MVEIITKINYLFFDLKIYLVIFLGLFSCELLDFGCPDTWILFKRKCYKYLDIYVTQSEADKYCQNLGQNHRLTDVLDKYEFEFLTNLTKGMHVWTSGVIVSRENNTWRWLQSNQTMKFYSWAIGSPNNEQLNENCIYLDYRIVGMEDIRCDYRITFVCKSDMPCSLNSFDPVVVVETNISTVISANITTVISATFSCKKNYSYFGPSMLTCSKESSWNFTKSNMPKCIKVLCLNKFIFSWPLKMQLIPEPIYGNFMRFSCNKGFTLEGDEIVMCLSTGQWNMSNKPTCVSSIETSIMTSRRSILIKHSTSTEPSAPSGVSSLIVILICSFFFLLLLIFLVLIVVYLKRRTHQQQAASQTVKSVDKTQDAEIARKKNLLRNKQRSHSSSKDSHSTTLPNSKSRKKSLKISKLLKSKSIKNENLGEQD